ncbi:MAG: hypothetical protein EOP42_09950 [Sphingobacteriaceae bacterium]|nr:MAG: hypothetical protein EOP42_09950 [Sphingobacteriaceae bacterium]
MITKQDKIRFAATLINEGKIDTVDRLYQFLSKKAVAEILGVNSTRFSNLKSNHPGDFKMSDLDKLSKALNVELYAMVNIFKNSLAADDAAVA